MLFNQYFPLSCWLALQKHNLKWVLFFQVKTIYVPTGIPLASESSAPLVATLPLEVISAKSMTCLSISVPWSQITC